MIYIIFILIYLDFHGKNNKAKTIDVK